MGLRDIIEKLEGERREAYVRAVLRAAESNDVLGYIGHRVPLELFDALGLMVLPVWGVDGGILEFSTERDLCPVIDATLTYAQTDRCPLIHSSRLIVVDDSCPVMAQKMRELPEKDVYIYRAGEPGARSALAEKLEQVYGRRLDEGALAAAAADREKAASLLRRLKEYSSLTGLQVYILEYYLNFLPMSERLDILQNVSAQAAFSPEPGEFIPVRVQSGAGIYRQIDRMFAGKNYRIVEAGCQNGPYDFVYESCPFAGGARIRYE